jgi:hypothetical protein
MMEVTLKLSLRKVNDDDPEPISADVQQALVTEFTDASVYVDHSPQGEVIATEYRIQAVTVVDE